MKSYRLTLTLTVTAKLTAVRRGRTIDTMNQPTRAGGRGARGCRAMARISKITIYSFLYNHKKLLLAVLFILVVISGIIIRT